MRKIYKMAGFICLGLVLSSQNTNAQTVSDFENLTLTPNTFWDGSDLSGTHVNKQFLGSFTDGDAIYPNLYDTTFGAPGIFSLGFSYSNMQDSTTAGFGNIFSARTAVGVNNSSNYAIVTQDVFNGLTPNLLLSGTAANNTVSGMYVTNSTYAAISMRDGDFAGKVFGSANDANGSPDGTNGEDWFLLTIKGYTGGNLTGDSVNFYLADFRFTNNTLDYIVTDWQWVDLTSLGAIDSLNFELTSSDVGSFGMNTPAFFAMDDFNNQSVSIDELAQEINFSVYPNPANNYFYLSLKNDIKTIQIIDITGKPILSETNLKAGTHKMDLSNLSSGIYFVKAITNNGIKVVRFIKQ
jgi:hypothetical protein